MSGETPARRASTRVLCIDDDPLVLHFLRGFLEPRGYRILMADDGLRGLELARRERPDVILLDLMLHGLSGFDICRKLRAAGPLRTTPIILLTVVGDPHVPITAEEAGATITLRKPTDPETIVSTIEQVLGQKERPEPE